MPTDTTVHVQGGAEYMRTIKDRTKANLKRLIKEQPHNVFLYDTSAVTPSKFSGNADTLPQGMTFTVVGPDPYTKRDWYANIYRSNDGTLKVK